MKKLFLLLMLALGLAASAPKAEAGQYRRVYTDYGPTYVHKSALYGHNNYGSRDYYGSDYRRHSRYRKSYRSHRCYEPVHYGRRYRTRDYYRSYDDGYYGRPVYYSSRPRIAVSFGF